MWSSLLDPLTQLKGRAAREGLASQTTYVCMYAIVPIIIVQCTSRLVYKLQHFCTVICSLCAWIDMYKCVCVCGEGEESSLQTEN